MWELLTLWEWLSSPSFRFPCTCRRHQTGLSLVKQGKKKHVCFCRISFSVSRAVLQEQIATSSICSCFPSEIGTDWIVMRSERSGLITTLHFYWAQDQRLFCETHANIKPGVKTTELHFKEVNSSGVPPNLRSVTHLSPCRRTSSLIPGLLPLKLHIPLCCPGNICFPVHVWIYFNA